MSQNMCKKKGMYIARISDKIRRGSDIVYLIIENEERYQDRQDNWLLNFPASKYLPISSYQFIDKTRIEKRKLME